MRELSLNILDIAQNGITAQATQIHIQVEIFQSKNLMQVIITDNGRGMSAELLNRVCDPFATTRTTRKVGMGLPLYKMGAEMCGGEFKISSEVGKGTSVFTSYQLDHIDRPPLGDLALTITMMMGGAPNVSYKLDFKTETGEYSFDSSEVASILDGVPIDSPPVLEYLHGEISDAIRQLGCF